MRRFSVSLLYLVAGRLTFAQTSSNPPKFPPTTGRPRTRSFFTQTVRTTRDAP